LNIKLRRKLGYDVDIDYRRFGLCNVEVHAAAVIVRRGVHAVGTGLMTAF
jgi:hypothetical protein